MNIWIKSMCVGVFMIAFLMKAGSVAAEIPLCDDHVDSEFHGLYDYESNCHFDHEHHDDPNLVNDIFGVPGGWWRGRGTISYPWQTMEMMENIMKHEGYKWYVRRNMPCKPVNSEGCLTDFRIQAHFMPTAMDAVTRYHSVSYELKVCYDGQCGIIRSGGWMDFGYLEAGGKKVELDSDKNLSTNDSLRRIHNSLINDQTNRNRDATWYGGLGVLNIGLRAISWGPISWDPISSSGDPEKQLFWCEDAYKCDIYNGSQAGIDLINVQIAPWDYDIKDGKINYQGFVDRYGKKIYECSAVDIDCIPMIMENVPVQGAGITNFQYRSDIFENETTLRDYDTSPKGEYWIKYPN